MKLTYAVVFEQAPNNYCAYIPDLPGCISTGRTWEEMQWMIREAITVHLEVMHEYGDPIPLPQMSVEQALEYHPFTAQRLRRILSGSRPGGRRRTRRGPGG